MRVKASTLLSQLESLTVWRRGGERAPNKPLLLLYALGRLTRGQGRIIPYADVDRDLRLLLEEFGPARRVVHPEYPFWRLERDGDLWEVRWPAPTKVRERFSADPSARALRDAGVEAGFTAAVAELLEADPDLCRKAVEILLIRHFPESIHEEILTAVGLDQTWETVRRRARDSSFRERVLIAWAYQCGVCGFDARIGTISVGLDAAHIRWKQVGGPDVEQNGIALCALHHRLFDRGAFTLGSSGASEDSVPLRLIVSKRAIGGPTVDRVLLALHASELPGPGDPNDSPSPMHLAWHEREVFRGPARG